MCSKREKACLKGCEGCLRWIPVLFIFLVLGWSYYAYVYSLCIVQVQSVVAKACFLVFYHIFLIMFCWSYIKAILVRPIKPPNEFSLSVTELGLIRSNEADGSALLEKIVMDRCLPVFLLGADGRIRVCHTCGFIKPDRAHHCSTCETCLLKMDHHCPWTNNCIGFHNHKYFIVFLAWGTIYCFFIVCTSAAYFADFWAPGQDLSVDRFQVLFVFIIATMFGFCQLGLCIYHLYLVGINQSTLEVFQPPKLRDGLPDRRAFNLGCKENFRETFGPHVCAAIIPISTTLGDGVHWRFRPTSTGYQSLESGHDSATMLTIKNVETL